MTTNNKKTTPTANKIRRPMDKIAAAFLEAVEANPRVQSIVARKNRVGHIEVQCRLKKKPTKKRPASTRRKKAA